MNHIKEFNEFLIEKKSLKVKGDFYDGKAEDWMINKWKSPSGLSITAANGLISDTVLDFKIYLSNGDSIGVKGSPSKTPKITFKNKAGKITNASWDKFADTTMGYSRSLIYDLLLFWEEFYDDMTP